MFSHEDVDDVCFKEFFASFLVADGRVEVLDVNLSVKDVGGAALFRGLLLEELQ